MHLASGRHLELVAQLEMAAFGGTLELARPGQPPDRRAALTKRLRSHAVDRSDVHRCARPVFVGADARTASRAEREREDVNPRIGGGWPELLLLAGFPQHHVAGCDLAILAPREHPPAPRCDVPEGPRLASRDSDRGSRRQFQLGDRVEVATGSLLKHLARVDEPPHLGGTLVLESWREPFDSADVHGDYSDEVAKARSTETITHLPLQPVVAAR